MDKIDITKDSVNIKISLFEAYVLGIMLGAGFQMYQNIEATTGFLLNYLIK